VERKGGVADVVKLTKKQKAFADEYLRNGGNATQAAIKAGYSQKTANRIGPQNLSKLVVKEYLDEKMKPIEKRREINADDALNELISIWQGEIQISTSKQIDNLKKGKVKKDMQYEFTPDLENRIKALDLYLKYKSLLSQTQLEKARKEIELMQLKLEALQNNKGESTESKLDKLLETITGELDGA